MSERKKDFYELFNFGCYTDVYEHVTFNGFDTLITAAKKMFDENDFTNIAQLMGSDCALKEVIRHCCIFTIDRLSGIKNNSFETDIRLKMQQFKNENLETFIWWKKMLSSPSISWMPLWDLESFQQLVYPVLKEKIEYVDISELLSIYFTCYDNEYCDRWCHFLALAIFYVKDEDAKKISEFMASIDWYVA